MTDLNDSVEKLKRFLRGQGCEPVELENGLRLKWDSERVIEINALTRDSDYFWASMETTSADAKERRLEIDSVHESLAASLLGLATLGSFEQTQDADGRFVYVANVELNPAIVYYGSVDMDDVSATEWTAPASPEEQVFQEQVPATEMTPSASKTLSRKKSETSAKKKSVAKPQAEDIPQKTDLSNMITPPPDQPLDPVEAARAVVAKLENIDGKMIRQSLDMMNLRRSSTIRLMLTRIFRSAVEPEDLMRSIREEAGKIISAEDRQELEMVRILSENSFLEPVVKLLHMEAEKRFE